MFISLDDARQTEKSFENFTNLFDFYALPSSSVVTADVVTPRHNKLPPVSFDSYGVPAAASGFLPSLFRSNHEEVAKRSLLRTMSDRRQRVRGPADVMSRLVRPLLLVQTSYEAGSRHETESTSAPASASSVVMEARKASSRCFTKCFAAASIWLSWLFLCPYCRVVYQLLLFVISMFCIE